MNPKETVTIHSATFNPKVKAYIFIVVLFYLITSVIGILLIPFWIFGLGQWLSNKFFHTLSCTLTNKNLQFSKGLIIHIEKTIPLENIQDLSFIGGPVLRYFGLTLIRVETAGGGGSHHTSNMMSMLGVEKAEEFKLMILQQREILIKEKSGFQPQVQPADADNKLLAEIRDELREIKNVLKNKNI